MSLTSIACRNSLETRKMSATSAVLKIQNLQLKTIRYIMPIGVPKFPTKCQDQYTPMVDIYNRLYPRRIIFLGRDGDSTNQIIINVIPEFRIRAKFISSIPRRCYNLWYGNL